MTVDTIEAWDENADVWDQAMGEGNDFHRILISPNVEPLLIVKKKRPNFRCRLW